jgi:superfamily II DNA/RNA helicase
VASAFADGTFNVMVATDVAAEGMDFRTCGLVVAFNSPASARCDPG